MNSLQNDFLKRSVAALENLTALAANESSLTPEFLREVFRTLHTVKGTAQTFGFSNSAETAHELENLLSGAQENEEFLSPEFRANLLQGFALLIDSFVKSKKFSILKSRIEDNANSNKPAPKVKYFNNPEPEVFKKFSEHERKLLSTEINKGKNIYFINVDFELKKFAEEFKNLRKKIFADGEIIAASPNPKPAGKGLIGFQICFASKKSIAHLLKNLKSFSTDIFEQKLIPQNDLDQVLKHLAAHGKSLAEKFGKDVEINVSAEKIALSAEKTSLIFEILLHLLRNAVDHAVETESERINLGKEKCAKLEIAAASAKDGINLSISDDGKGIDAEKVKAQAIKKSLFSDDKTLTESEMIDLIFLPEFSTAETITEISGRGIGLDAVKILVENAGGTISVKSRMSFGTTFEIFLPL